LGRHQEEPLAEILEHQRPGPLQIKCMQIYEHYFGKSQNLRDCEALEGSPSDRVKSPELLRGRGVSGSEKMA
jgi:hypothetical protein